MFERIKARGIEGKIRLQQAEMLSDQLTVLAEISENNYILPEADEADWRLLGSNAEKGLDSNDQETLREQSIKTYFKSAHGRNIIRLFEKYVVGRGFHIMPISKVPGVKEEWEEFWKVNKMALRKKEIVRRTMRDGETFLRYFDDITPIKIRFMNPSFVADPDKPVVDDDKITDGIVTDSEDIETVKAYYYKNKRVPVEEVQHTKILVDSDVLRGRSYYEPLLQLLTMYKKWLIDRMKLNEIRNTVALIKKTRGTPTQAANIATGHETTRKLAADNTTLHRAPKNVSVYTTNQNVDYELKSPNLQAQDVQHDGRGLLLAVAAGSGLPEFMISSDASNGSYASTMIAEGPGVMEFEDWQDFFGELFKEMFRRVIQNGIKNNRIPENEKVMEKRLMPGGTMEEVMITVPISLECSITFPDIVSRDIKAETDAYILQNNQGWISDQTASGRLDLDYEEEQRLIEQVESEEKEEEEAKE